MNNVINRHCYVLHQRTIAFVHILVDSNHRFLSFLDALTQFLVEQFKVLSCQLLLDEGVQVPLSFILLLMLGCLLIGFIIATIAQRAHLLSFCFIWLLIRLQVIEIVVVPGLWWARIILCEHKDKVIWAELYWLLWVSDNVFDLLFFLTRGITIAVEATGKRRLIDLELLIVNHLAAVEADWDHEPPRRQIIEQAWILALCELRWDLYVIKIGGLHVWEILLPDWLTRTCLWLLCIANDQLLQYIGELTIVVGLAEERVHQRW